MNKIKWVTQAIAQPCEIQKGLFPDFVNVADELAVEWEMALDELSDPEVSSQLTDEQKSAIKRLDDYMLSISGADNIQYWSNEALSQSVEWKNMREMAETILVTMKWEKSIPSKNDAIYITNSQ
ncbi:hypothetical protein [Pragia fontium]|uniref:Uncharacterized protein n=2 Tax=Pragia fontium TaxID=82985 RepID=A0AAJ5BH29_9GAMM|nr:hypothetical protein [Pragia fontium]GKX61437.1 hypothetical protein SOASR032_00060 [Pragia fontium]SFC76829.1 hypothetical protein SAMN02745723_10473 [Pragia fontium DSM 5563 = ATCC 49100]